ncbi:MAG: aminoglycoside phosphotransferase family protein [Planctomycetaceae bacterium]|nr:aminoglycoside phosphotransferase family protein [Planctomycetaceae bacterium]
MGVTPSAKKALEVDCRTEQRIIPNVVCCTLGDDLPAPNERPNPLSFPPAEIHVDVAVVRRLLEVDCPSLSHGTISLVDEGWDNLTYRLGSRHAVRLPRRAAAAGLLANEQAWLPILAPRLPLEIPVPVHIGKPSTLFPWPWSVVNWIPGLTAEHHSFAPADVSLLAETLVSLHQPAPEAAPRNPFRGVSLRAKNDLVKDRLHSLEQRDGITAQRLAAIWRDACHAPETEQRVWLHGDLHARNVVVNESRLVGLIDWGDLNGGDPANDLACAWTLIESARLRRAILEAYGADDALVRRAMGWAIHFGLTLVNSGEPRHVPMGSTVLNRLLADV